MMDNDIAVTLLTPEQWDQFLAMLESPPKPTKALTDLMAADFVPPWDAE